MGGPGIYSQRSFTEPGRQAGCGRGSAVSWHGARALREEQLQERSALVYTLHEDGARYGRDTGGALLGS